ncbi:thioredoxin [Skermanella stibiiresistens SB22]|uniref:Thioredoxin n=1 Tax=Skermanella stibiiresistens SB22 TaxID=1385369 RepID=W9H8M9_9PROT|nr:thioredoxin [Skermanella stibiiresistens]EWY42409.1 thioredoxin [Skermanella stibiiresistens SB22]
MQTMFNAPGAGPKPGADLIKDTTDQAFMADVMEVSRTVPVIVDFWAPWCGPCKQLGPMLEKTVNAAKGAVKMVKINIDENPQIAGQLRIQSIPAVYAFFQGRPVDGFVGAQQESQIKQFVDRLIKLGGAGADDGGLQEALDAAAQALEAGDAATASDIYGQILEVEPTNVAAYAGLIRCLIAAEDHTRARQMLDGAAPEMAKAPELAAVRSALDLAEQSAAAGPVGDLMDKLARDPNDHQTRFDLAMALYASNKREEAVDELLEIVRRDREWNEQQARKQLVKFFEAFGPTDKLTLMARRKLSSILFS